MVSDSHPLNAIDRSKIEQDLKYWLGTQTIVCVLYTFHASPATAAMLKGAIP